MVSVRRSAWKRWFGVALLGAISAGMAWGVFGGGEASEEGRPALAAAGRLGPRLGHDERPWLLDRAARHEPGNRTNSNPAETDEPAAMPEHPTDRVRPVPSTPPSRQRAPAPKVLVKVRGVMGLEDAQVKVGALTVTVGDLREVLVTAGRKTLRWRAHERDVWRSGGSWRFEAGMSVLAFVTAHGLELRTIP